MGKGGSHVVELGRARKCRIGWDGMFCVVCY